MLSMADSAAASAAPWAICRCPYNWLASTANPIAPISTSPIAATTRTIACPFSLLLRIACHLKSNNTLTRRAEGHSAKQSEPGPRIIVVLDKNLDVMAKGVGVTIRISHSYGEPGGIDTSNIVLDHVRYRARIGRGARAAGAVGAAHNRVAGSRLRRIGQVSVNEQHSVHLDTQEQDDQQKER